MYISSHLIPLYSGIDINDLLLDCAIGRPIDMDAVLSTKFEKAAGDVCFYLPEGQIKSISGIEDTTQCPGVEMADIHTIDVGMKTMPMTHKGLRQGPILVSANNREELDKRIMRIQHSLNIQVLSPDGTLNGINWS